LVIVDDIKTEAGRCEASITVNGKRYELFFRSQLEFSDHASDALLILALPAAMRVGAPLTIKAPVSPLLLNNIPAIQDIYCDWDAKFHLVKVNAPVRSTSVVQESRLPARETVSFTGGVDSFYSALERPESSLMFVHGFDIPLSNAGLRKTVSRRLSWAAAELNRPLLEVETNLREFSDHYLKWQLAFGGALSACALLLSRHMDVFWLSAGHSLEHPQPDGVHPVLNPLCGTEDLIIRTSGFKASRIEKVEAMAEHPVVQGALRVCWQNRGDAYNCGVCEKCLRTMAALEIFGVLAACSTFEVALDYGRLSRATAIDPSVEFFIEENLQAAREKNASPALISALEKSLDPRRVWFFRLLHYKVPRKVYDWSYRVFPHRKKAEGDVE